MPQLLDSERVSLRVLSGFEVENLCELFRQSSPRSFRKDDHLRANIDTWLEVRFPATFLVDSFVADADAGDATVLDENPRRCKLREKVDAHLAEERSHPSNHLAERDDVVSVVLQRWREDRNSDLRILGHVPECVIADGCLYRTTTLKPVGDQFDDAAWIHHGAGDSMRADLFALLENGDGEPLEFLFRA